MPPTASVPASTPITPAPPTAVKASGSKHQTVQQVNYLYKRQGIPFDPNRYVLSKRNKVVSKSRHELGKRNFSKIQAYQFPSKNVAAAAAAAPTAAAPGAAITASMTPKVN